MRFTTHVLVLSCFAALCPVAFAQGTAVGRPGTGVSAEFFNGKSAAHYWQLEGNGSVGTGFLGSTGADPLVFKTSSVERARFLATGNLGIGTVVPASLLTLDGTLGILGGSYHTTITGGAQSANVAYTLPTAQGAASTFLQNDGTGVLSWATGGTVSGSGVATRVAFWSAASTLSSNANLFWDNVGSNLGVGTETPAARIHASNVGMGTTLASSSPFLAVGNTDVTNNNWSLMSFRKDGGTAANLVEIGMQVENHATPSAAFVAAVTGGSGLLEAFRITSTGSVIFSTAALYTSTGGPIFFGGPPGVGLTGAAVVQDSSNLRWDDTNNVLAVGSGVISTGNNIHCLVPAASSYALYGSGAWTDANGGIRLDNSNAATGGSIIYLRVAGASTGDAKVACEVTGGTNWAFGVDNSDSDKWKVGPNFTLGTSTAMTIDTSGLVGIGTESPANKLTVDGTLSILGGSYHSTFTGGSQVANVAYTLPTAAPTANGQILSSTTAGVMSWAAPPAGTQRIIGSGSDTVAATTTTTVGTFTRNANERLQVLGFVTDNVAGVDFANDVGNTLGVIYWCERTANANEFTVQINNTTLSARTVDWLVMGIIP